ncbi:hypothetical protein BDW02DRAFT_609246 [Decorospora gaudefroyi]|uniref:Secreted protein n=1 Tax=Decorospora gaudefroyi TaxID=184978 RepID=A0A6A5K1T9_9PLEO|nr:hypothetical protein BDW02DRAFT_609246 [Decorospora gaudefroyi]
MILRLAWLMQFQATLETTMDMVVRTVIFMIRIDVLRRSLHPLATQRRIKSWAYRYLYRFIERNSLLMSIFLEHAWRADVYTTKSTSTPPTLLKTTSTLTYNLRAE